jgi:phosphate transport system permease protein
MNAHSAIAADPPPSRPRKKKRSNVRLRNTMRTQRIQDFFFHKITLLFAPCVLVVLVGIIVSLAIGAAPCVP